MNTPVATLEEAVARLLPKALAIRELAVERLAMFRSVVRGEPRPASDADMLVRFVAGGKTYDRFLELGELLEEALGRPVELVTVESLSPILGPKILAEARDVVRAARLRSPHLGRGGVPPERQRRPRRVRVPV